MGGGVLAERRSGDGLEESLLTLRKDPAGNALTFTFDGELRL